MKANIWTTTDQGQYPPATATRAYDLRRAMGTSRMRATLITERTPLATTSKAVSRPAISAARPGSPTRADAGGGRGAEQRRPARSDLARPGVTHGRSQRWTLTLLVEDDGVGPGRTTCRGWGPRRWRRGSAASAAVAGSSVGRRVAAPHRGPVAWSSGSCREKIVCRMARMVPSRSSMNPDNRSRARSEPAHAETPAVPTATRRWMTRSCGSSAIRVPVLDHRQALPVGRGLG